PRTGIASSSRLATPCRGAPRGAAPTNGETPEGFLNEIVSSPPATGPTARALAGPRSPPTAR
ncbi:hypothetical protein EXE48_18330, partial [Halorubrum sp. ASP1]